MKFQQQILNQAIKGEDWDVLEGIFLSGKEALDFEGQDCLFRMALLSEVRKLRQLSELDSAHGLAADLSETLVKEALG